MFKDVHNKKCSTEHDIFVPVAVSTFAIGKSHRIAGCCRSEVIKKSTRQRRYSGTRTGRQSPYWTLCCNNKTAAL